MEKLLEYAAFGVAWYWLVDPELRTRCRPRALRAMSQLRGLLERLVRVLDEVGVPFMIAGSFASAAHGLPRTTQEWSQQSGGSERQRRDIAGIIATIGAALDRAYVERWVLELNLAGKWDKAQQTSL